jgi:RNA polymerase sigma factor (sigma-70 family)
LLKKVIKGCRKRRRNSQKELYQMFYAYGMSITLRYADTRDEGVMILNDAFMKVFENIQSYNTERPFKPWFRRIIINTAINHFRRKQTLNRVEISRNPDEPEAGRDETITAGIAYREMLAMVQRLTPACRMVFNLYAIEGFTHREIAEQLGIAEGTSKSNLSKARQKLKKMLEKHLTEPPENVRST